LRGAEICCPSIVSLGLRFPRTPSPPTPPRAGCWVPAPVGPQTTAWRSRVCPGEVPGLFTPTCGSGDAGKDGEGLGDASTALPHPYLPLRVQAPPPGSPGRVSPPARSTGGGGPCAGAGGVEGRKGAPAGPRRCRAGPAHRVPFVTPRRSRRIQLRSREAAPSPAHRPRLRLAGRDAAPCLLTPPPGTSSPAPRTDAPRKPRAWPGQGHPNTPQSSERRQRNAAYPNAWSAHPAGFRPPQCLPSSGDPSHPSPCRCWLETALLALPLAQMPGNGRAAGAQHCSVSSRMGSQQ